MKVWFDYKGALNRIKREDIVEILIKVGLDRKDDQIIKKLGYFVNRRETIKAKKDNTVNFVLIGIAIDRSFWTIHKSDTRRTSFHTLRTRFLVI